MREIKFRGIELESGNWVYGSLLPYEPCPEIQSTELDENAYDYDKWEVNPETVGQFTGLKDKNGVDIYEGDIVRLIINQNSPSYIGGHVNNLEYNTVVQYHHYASFVFKNITEKRPKSYGFHSMNYGHTRMHTDLIEIIGNIHQNPELLK